MLERVKICPVCGDSWSSLPGCYATCRVCGYLLVDLQPGDVASKGEEFECLLHGKGSFLATKDRGAWSSLECPRCLEKWPDDPQRRSLYFDALAFLWWIDGYSTNGSTGLACSCGSKTQLLVNGACAACRRAA